VEYIKALNKEYELNSNSLDMQGLIGFIDKKLGSKSSAGYLCKIRIEFALDISAFYAKRIRKLGHKYKKNQNKLSDIFIQRMNIDLSAIQRVWALKKYSDGTLKEWLAIKSSNSTHSMYLSQILDHCAGSYAQRKRMSSMARELLF